MFYERNMKNGGQDQMPFDEPPGLEGTVVVAPCFEHLDIEGWLKDRTKQVQLAQLSSPAIDGTCTRGYDCSAQGLGSRT
jgi:hypothetical protein